MMGTGSPSEQEASLELTIVARGPGTSDTAIWVHPSDPSRSRIVTAQIDAPSGIHTLDGRSLSNAPSAFTHIEVAYDFIVGESTLDLLLGHDPKRSGVVALAVDPESASLSELTRHPLEVGAELTGLCSYRSALSGTFFFFAVTDTGIAQQWALFDRDGQVDAKLVRAIPIGVGAGPCAVDAASETLFVSEEKVGIWSLSADPESDAEREFLDLVGERGHLREEVKGLAIYRADDATSYLLAADVADRTRINVYSIDASRYLGSVGLAHTYEDIEGLTSTSAALGDSLREGMITVADEKQGYAVVAWRDIADRLRLQSASNGDPRARYEHEAHAVSATLETPPVDDYGDAADDPAIWVHPTDPARSLIIGAQKKRGLYVYDLKGETVQVVADGRMNNVDLRAGFRWQGKDVAVVAASNRSDRSLALYVLDTEVRRLVRASPAIPTGFDDPYGLCMYRSPKTGHLYVFMNDSDSGAYKQWRLTDGRNRIDAQLVREFVVGSQAEGCAADDETGALYIAEEDVGLWRYEAEPAAGERREAIDDTTSAGRLTADVEGVAIYYGRDGDGYVIVSNQGRDDYVLYTRNAENAFVGRFAIAADPRLGIDGASETDGIDVASAPMGNAFPFGVFVAQDGRNITPSERQNFKVVPWERIANALSLKLSESHIPPSE